LYVTKQQVDDAKSCFERALSISEKSFGADDLRLARPLDELGYLMSNKLDYQKAETFFSRSLMIKEKSLKPDDIEVARAAFVLGEVYRKSHQYAKAEPLYQQAIRTYEKYGKKGDAELLQVLKNYLNILVAENRKDEAALVQARLAELAAQAGVVEGGLLNGTAIKLVQPAYPSMAPRVPLVIVQVRVLIDETGRVIKAEATGHPHPSFKAAAEEAARHSVFTPTLLSGTPVKVTGTIIYNFFLR
jgi:tetratricopeptide (TPR) repeat protein